MSKKTEIAKLTAEDIAGHVKDIAAKIEQLEPHLAEGAHLITGIGALRTAVACFGHHAEVVNQPAAPAAE